MKRELERKNDECEARMKVELGEARTLWNKERQEEIQQIRAQNEKDYRTFLNEHRTKVIEVLSTAKADFEKQRNELVSQKEAELTEIFNQQLKQRTCEETWKIQDYNEEILCEIELLMSDIHDNLVEKRVPERFSKTSSNLDAQFLDKLRSCLQKSVMGIAYQVISNAKSEWKQNLDENFAKNHHLSEKQSNGEQLKRKTDNSAFCCCENCLQHLEKYKKDCQELRSKLDKACRHLQQAVKDQKLKAEQFKSNEIVTQNLRQENAELHKTLEEVNSNRTSQSNQQDEGSEKGCSLCRGNALDEMRAQYIKAVDKIKNDMLRYIHDSKGRAAEMLKNEVLRERQETARKMRKYYLTCLQQLLKDDGKNMGAEKKIMNAASKLATMAKVLETPVSQKTKSRNFHVGFAVSQDESDSEASEPMRNVVSFPSNRSSGGNAEQKTLNELIRRHAKEKGDGGRFTNTEDPTTIRLDDSKQCGKDNIEHKAAGHIARSMSTALDDCLTFNGPNVNADSLQVTFHKQSEPSVLHGLQDHGNMKSRPDKQRFELHETPVRDENGSNDWTCMNIKGPFLTQTTQSSVTHLKALSQNLNIPGNFSAAGLFPFVEASHDGFGSRYEGQNHSAHIAKKRDQTPGTQHPSKAEGHPSAAVESKPYSDVGRGSQLLSRKLLLDFVSPKQDSGFDSPLLT
ncbi:unnamed protein product [Ranitomeya imitator]|uniref:CEP152 CEP63 binding coiled coil domain-containing protein n=1 Tax=Ranitomeya imitator TaxID=111125 RepID=A0ABN9MIF0_9NEOB|nr:unnamed protein product [Ranitomeya imitator]